MKKLLASVFIIGLAANVFCQTKQSIHDGAILHAFCWSFKTIEENLPKIKESGFTAVQTSPANTCLEGEYGGLELMGKDLTGKWYYHYQPTDWKIGNYQLGTRDDFISMCKKAEELGIGIIVDVLPNHTTPNKKAISKEFIEAVGGMDKLYHQNASRGITNWGDRNQLTTYSMGGLPDVNTENPDFQAYFMKYMNDLIDCGADGFRFDTAKHVGLPDDPKDPASKENDFWLIFTGKKAIKGEMLHRADELFLYGEVLQGGGSREEDYGEFINVTASNYGGVLRSSLWSKKLSAKGLANWKHPLSADRLVSWVESHDTYANQGESAALKHAQLRIGWAVIAAREGSTPLFFSRPKGREGVQFPGVSKIGDAGNDEFMHPEVREVNKFRIAMAGESEELVNGKDTSLLAVKRGNKGVVLININPDKKAKVSIPVAFEDGEYTDRANGIKFTVKDGTLTGTMKKQSVCVIY